MPRQLPVGLSDLFALPNKRLDTHTTLQVRIDNGDIQRGYYFATAELLIDGSVYEPAVRQSSEIRQSLTAAADLTTVEIQNVDLAVGLEFLSLGQAIYGAQVSIGRYWKDKDSEAEFHKVLLTGPLISQPSDDNAVRITAVSDAYANISVGATRRITLSCGWNFRQIDTCGYNGTLLTCNFLLNHSGGCEGRHGTPLKQAKFGGFAFLDSGSRLKTI